MKIKEADHCPLCARIHKAMEERALEPKEAAHVAAVLVGDNENIKYFCSCGAPLEKRTVENRLACEVKNPYLCPACREGRTKEYVGADIGGELVFTNTHEGERHFRRWQKGGHAIQ